jgi:hypothetical protein
VEWRLGVDVGLAALDNCSLPVDVWGLYFGELLLGSRRSLYRRRYGGRRERKAR